VVEHRDAEASEGDAEAVDERDQIRAEELGRVHDPAHGREGQGGRADHERVALQDREGVRGRSVVTMHGDRRGGPWPSFRSAGSGGGGTDAKPARVDRVTSSAGSDASGACWEISSARMYDAIAQRSVRGIWLA